MNVPLRPFLLITFLTLCTLGCAPQQTFDVTVTNKLSDPVTVWMTKAKQPKNGSYEDGWMPPEMVAVGTTGSQHLGGVAVEPGESAHTVLKGTIASDDVAILRVYRATDLNMMLTMHYGDPNRLDIPLGPGTTDIDIVKQNGQMTDVPHGTSP
jgi:hypothetical protein